MPDTDRHAMRSSTATTDKVAWQTSQAAVSSNAVLNRDPGRAHGTAATTTPWPGQHTRRVKACKNTGVVPMSRPRQRRGCVLTS